MNIKPFIFIHIIIFANRVWDKENAARLKYRAAGNREPIYQLVCAPRHTDCSCHHIVVTGRIDVRKTISITRFSFFFFLFRPPLRHRLSHVPLPQPSAIVRFSNGNDIFIIFIRSFSTTTIALLRYEIRINGRKK